MTNKTLLTLVLTLAFFAPTLTQITATVICYTKTSNQEEYYKAELKNHSNLSLNDPKVFGVDIFDRDINPEVVSVSDPRGFSEGCQITLKVIGAEGLNIEISEKIQNEENSKISIIDMPQDVEIRNNKNESVTDMLLSATALIHKDYCTSDFLYTDNKWKKFFVNQYSLTEWRSDTSPNYNPPAINPENIEEVGLEALKYMKFPKLLSDWTINSLDDGKPIQMLDSLACIIVPPIQSELKQKEIEDMHSKIELEAQQRAQDAIDRGEVIERMLIV